MTPPTNPTVPATAAKPGPAKIVKLGSDTLLIIEIQNGDQLTEGACVINSISTGPTVGGGGCTGVQIVN